MPTHEADGSRTYAEADYTDFAHTGPGTLAGRWMRMFWQPVYCTEDLLPGYAKPVRIMGEDFTLYRGEGGVPHAVAFRCAHRGTQLSTGWVEGDCIRCFYHGWKYDAAGQCVEQPAEDAGFAQKVRIRSYPVTEYLGLLFVYFGEGAPPPPPSYADMEVEGVLEVDTYVRRCNYFNNLENDPVHLAFVHRDSFLEAPAVPEILEYEETEYGLKIVHRMGQVIETDHRIVPNGVLVPFPPRYAEGSAGTAMAAWRVPIDDETHVNYRLKRVFITGEAADRYRAEQAARTERQLEAPADLAERVLRGEVRIQDLKDSTDIQLLQDDVAMVGQGRIADRTQERLGRSDVSVILQRKIWERELRALAEGRPLKKWLPPRAGLVLPVHA
jgi:5,5'-dehydrodivanillate O-demethylase oxygenase subunit